MNRTQALDDIKKYNFALLEKKSESDPYFLYLLGVAYYFGMKVDEDRVKAFDCFKKAAELDEPLSFYALAGMYARGDIFPQDLDTAKSFYEKSVSFKDYDSYVALGNMITYPLINHIETLNTDKFYKIKSLVFNLKKQLQNHSEAKKAIRYYEKAIEHNVADGYYYLCIHYKHGLGVQVDVSKALQFIESAIKINKHKEYLYLKGVLLELLGQNTEAFRAYEEASNLGHKDAQHILALAIHDGLYEGDMDYVKSLLIKASMQNNGKSQSFLSDLYFLEKNYVKSYEWALKAYSNNHFSLTELNSIKEYLSEEQLSLVDDIDVTDFQKISNKFFGDIPF